MPDGRCLIPATRKTTAECVQAAGLRPNLAENTKNALDRAALRGKGLTTAAKQRSSNEAFPPFYFYFLRMQNFGHDPFFTERSICVVCQRVCHNFGKRLEKSTHANESMHEL